jgi:hypothetical protein
MKCNPTDDVGQQRVQIVIMHDGEEDAAKRAFLAADLQTLLDEGLLPGQQLVMKTYMLQLADCGPCGLALEGSRRSADRLSRLYPRTLVTHDFLDAYELWMTLKAHRQLIFSLAGAQMPVST